MSINTVLDNKVEVNNSPVETENSNLSFQEKQALAYAFLSAFYDYNNLGYSVDNYSYTDVTQGIIDIVDEMGEQIVTNTRIVAIADLLYSIGTRVGLGATFTKAISEEFNRVGSLDFIQTIFITKSKLIEQKDLIMGGFLTRAVLIQILNARKQEIELRFLGFM